MSVITKIVYAFKGLCYAVFYLFNVSSYQLNSKYNFAVLLFVELAVAVRDFKSASVSFSFLFSSVLPKKGPRRS